MVSLSEEPSFYFGKLFVVFLKEFDKYVVALRKNIAVAVRNKAEVKQMCLKNICLIAKF